MSYVIDKMKKLYPGEQGVFVQYLQLALQRAGESIAAQLKNLQENQVDVRWMMKHGNY